MSTPSRLDAAPHAAHAAHAPAHPAARSMPDRRLVLLLAAAAGLGVAPLYYAQPMLGALGLVQFGVALLALAAMLQFSPKRRRLA